MRRLTAGLDRRAAARLGGSAASLVLLVYLLSRQGWGEILTVIRQIPTATLAGVLVLLVISRLAISTRWYVLLRVPEPAFPYTEAVRLTLAGLFAANFLPTTVGGDVVRAAGVLPLARNRVGAVASIVLDRLVGMAGMAVTLPLGLASLSAWMRAAGEAAVLLPAGVFGVVETAPRRPHLRRWLGDVIGRLKESWRLWLGQPASIARAFGFTFVHMLCLFGEVWLLFSAMGQDIAFATVAGLWGLAYFVTLIPISINGLGLREVSITYLYTEMASVSIESALAVALILRTLDILISLPGAILIPTIRTRGEPEGSTSP